MRGILNVIFGATVGVLYGLFFAQKPGKKLRKELGDSKNLARDFVNEIGRVEREAREVASGLVKDSEDLKRLIQTGKGQFEALVKEAEGLGGEAADVAQKRLEEVAKNAKKAADKLKKDAKRVAKRHTKKATRTAKKAIGTVKKTAKKATKTAKKTLKRVTK